MDEPYVLIVEDDQETRVLIETRLQTAGYCVTATPSDVNVLELLRAGHFALLITDVRLQSLDGVALMREAKAIDPNLEVIIVAGTATVDSAIAAVNHGARAFMRKPLAPGEIEERAAAALARRQSRMEQIGVLRQLATQLLHIAEPESPRYSIKAVEEDRVRIGPLQLDPRSRRAAIGSKAVPLSSGEFDLLLYLARRDNQVISVEEIAREVLRFPGCTIHEARELVKARIHRLRRKIEPNPSAPGLLISVRGIGYMLTSDE